MDWNTLCRRAICERMLDIRLHPPKVIARCRNFAEQVTQFLLCVHLLLVCISCDGFLICPYLIPPHPMQLFLRNIVKDFFQEQMQVAHPWDTAFRLGENTTTLYIDEINWHIFWSQAGGCFYKYQALYQPGGCLAGTKSSKRPTWQWTWLSMDVRHQISQRSPSFLQSGILLLTGSLASSLSCSRFEPKQKNVS